MKNIFKERDMSFFFINRFNSYINLNLNFKIISNFINVSIWLLISRKFQDDIFDEIWYEKSIKYSLHLYLNTLLLEKKSAYI